MSDNPRYKTPIALTEAERDTILAALRYWQTCRMPTKDLYEIATDGGTHAPLTDAEIDELCEEINV